MGSRFFDEALRADFDRSRDRSRVRRERSSRLRRRRLRTRGGALALASVVVCVAVAGAGLALGGTGAGGLKQGSRGPAVAALQRKLGVRADGAFGPVTERAVRRLQERRGLPVDGVVGAATQRALGLASIASAGTGGSGIDTTRRPTAGLPPVLLQIAECESHGDPHAVSSDGTYRGKYQFTRSMWRSMGGRGDPATAPESLQDRLALRLYRRSGTGPWPNCA